MSRVERTLVLFLTGGLSLADWEERGMLERETALYRRLADRGVRIVVASWGGRADLRLARDLGFSVVASRFPGPERLARLAWPYRLRKRIRGAGIVKSNQVKGADRALEFARRAGLPFIARCGYLASDFAERGHGADSLEALAARDLERTVFSGADRVVVTAEWMAETIGKRYGLDRERVRVIPNYVDREVFRPDPAVARVPGRVLFVGRLAEQKNLPLLLEAMAGLPAALEIVGEGPDRRALEAAAKARGVAARFLGALSGAEVAAAMRQASVYVLPSRYEGHPKTLLEAMACGTPVVATDVSGIREVVRHGETGWLAGETAESLREGIARLLDDSAERARLGENGRRFVAETFSLERVVTLETALYDELLGAGGATSR